MGMRKRQAAGDRLLPLPCRARLVCVVGGPVRLTWLVIVL